MQKPSGFQGLQIGRERNVLWGLARGVVPVGVGEAVAADVRLGAAEREQRHEGVAAVG